MDTEKDFLKEKNHWEPDPSVVFATKKILEIFRSLWDLSAISTRFASF
jgi:hypothetical protein